MRPARFERAASARVGVLVLALSGRLAAYLMPQTHREDAPAGVHSSVVLLGRREECARIDELLDLARLGRSGAVVIRGDPGIGKTALVEYAGMRAGGMRLLRAVGVESESDMPYSGLHELLRPIAGLIERLPRQQRTAMRGALAPTGGEIADRFAVYTATLGLVALAAGERPLVCLVDDAHWLDRGSAEALLFTARRLEDDDVAMVFAARDAPPRGLPAPGLPELRLGGLDAAAAVQLLVDHHGAIAADVARRIADATGGNPLALLEAPHEMRGAQLAGLDAMDDPIPVGKGIEHAFLARARGLPEPTAWALLLAATADRSEVDLILAAAEARPNVLDDAERVGLVRVEAGRIRFRHPLVRSAVYHGAPSRQRRAAHQALAAVLTAPEHADRQAWHLAAAATGPDESIACALANAAERVGRRGGIAAQAEFLASAADLSPDPGARVRRLLGAGLAAADAGLLERSDALLRIGLREVDDPLLRSDLVLARWDVMFRGGLAADWYEPTLATAAAIEAVDPDRAAALVAHAWDFAFDLREPGASRELAGWIQALTGGRALEATNLAASSALCWQWMADGRRDESAAAAERGARLALAGEFDQAAYFAECLTFTDRFTEAQRILEQLVARCRVEGRLTHLAYALVSLARLQLRRGRLRRSYATATEALTVARDTGAAWAIGYASQAIARSAAVLGRDRECMEHAERAIELGADNGGRCVEAPARHALGVMRLGRGDSVEALAHLKTAAEAVAEVLEPGFMCHEPDLIEALAATGHADDASHAVRRLSSAAEGTGADWTAAVAARCVALTMGGDEADDAFRVAIDRCSGQVPGFERARTQLLYGRWLRHAGRRADARPQLREAERAFDACGGLPWAEQAQRELVASGERARRRRPDTRDELTAQELQVASIVAEGASNSEAAARLFLSPKTIEKHLGNAYRKLGVRSRTQLANRLER
jgi:DNA-binding CsgD family transcriptional regulator